jgi:hypothetical protein
MSPRALSRSLLLVLFVGLGSAGGASAEDPEPSLKEAFSEVGRGIKEVARETGHATRDVVKATGAEAKRVAKEADAETRDERGEAAQTGKGLWAETRRGLARALEDFAAALRGLREEEADPE